MENRKMIVKEIVANALGLEIDEFENSTNIYDELGADSVVGFEILAKLKRKFQIPISSAEIMSLSSVDKICELVENRVNSKID